jgi:hypothetical protein
MHDAGVAPTDKSGVGCKTTPSIWRIGSLAADPINDSITLAIQSVYIVLMLMLILRGWSSGSYGYVVIEKLLSKPLPLLFL